MKQRVEALESDLAITVEFFTCDDCAIQLPFMHSFPMNCCEVVSALLARALANKYTDTEVVRMHGTDPVKHEKHFWVEVGDQVVDPTGHQFKGTVSPFVCAAPNPLVTMFPQLERESTEEALNALCSLNISTEMQIKILERLAAKLGPNHSFRRTRTLFYFNGHSDLTEGVIDGDARAANGRPLRS